MLLKIVGIILVVIIAMTAHAPHHPAPTDGVIVTAVCPQEDDLWEHPELCQISVDPR